MKRKLLSGLLCLALCLSLLPAALATEAPTAATAFTDVPAGSWFASGVKLCAEKGIMIGTGDGAFSPSATLSPAECLTLALRLYDLQRGGSGRLLHAPEDWDIMTFTADDGTTFTGKPGEVFDYVYPHGNVKPAVTGPFVALDEDQEEWCLTQSGKPLTLTLNGVDYPGTAISSGSNLLFDGSTPEELVRLIFAANRPGSWWRDSVYTAQQWGLTQQRGFSTLLWDLFEEQKAAFRDTFARALFDGAGTLEKKFDIPVIPAGRDEPAIALYRRLDDGPIFDLYEAGILSGVDAYGTFEPYKSLTRAEAAVMTARVLDESQRLTNPPQPRSYEASLAHLTWPISVTLEQQLESPYATALLAYEQYDFLGETWDYSLYLIAKEGSKLPAGTITRLVLPSTKVWRGEDGALYAPTDRAPDSLFIAAGETKLVYAYDFTDQLDDGDTVYHKAGRYIYTVDLKTGELNVDIPFKPDNVGDAHGSYQQAIDDLKNGQYPLSVDRQLEAETCSLLLGHVSAPHGGYYALKLVFKAGSQPGEGMVVSLPQPRVDFWDNGYAPHTLEISEDERFLIYAYHFDEPMGFDGGIFHEAGDYTYTVDLCTGVAAEELLPGNYEEVLSRQLQDEVYTVEQTLEGPFCTALLRYSHTDENALAHQSEGRKDYEITLVYKAGTDLPEGTLRSPNMPYTFSARTADGLGIYIVKDRAPDNMAFSDDGKQFIYSFQFDAPLLDPQGDPVHEAGTYVYTVDVPTGTTELDIQPNG